MRSCFLFYFKLNLFSLINCQKISLSSNTLVVCIFLYFIFISSSPTSAPNLTILWDEQQPIANRGVENFRAWHEKNNRGLRRFVYYEKCASWSLLFCWKEKSHKLLRCVLRMINICYNSHCGSNGGIYLERELTNEYFMMLFFACHYHRDCSRV